MREFLTLVPRGEAIERLRRAVKGQTRAPGSGSPGDLVELVEVGECAGRYLTADVAAHGDVPGFRRSTMDGYAVVAGDTFGASESSPALLEVIGECRVGAARGVRVGPGQAARIWTGAVLADGADAVVRVEDTLEFAEGIVGVCSPVAPGANVVRPDEDVAGGDLIARAGTRLSVAEAGLLAACGVTPVPVRRRPAFALVSTGCELVAPGGTPADGQVRDVNCVTLATLIRQAGGQPCFLGIVNEEGDAARLSEVCHEALERFSGLVISGGSSIGSRDTTASVIEGLGEPGVLAHGVAIRPGRPTVVGAVSGKPVLGLPGHPVSAFVSAMLFLAPAVAWLAGGDGWKPPCCAAVLSCNVPSQAGREDFVPARLSWQAWDADGGRGRGQGLPASEVPQVPQAAQSPPALPVAEPIFAKSGMISGLAAADGLVCIPAERGGAAAGEVVEVYLLRPGV